jgi:hypothetical protein
MAKFTYYVPARGATAYFVDSECRHPRDVAGDAARDFHFKHGGLDMEWPLDFIVVMQNGAEHRFSLRREVEPVFFASNI